MIKNCLQCNKEYKTKPSHFARRKYCSYACYDVARKTTLLGENNPCWRGGMPHCIDCNKELPFRDRTRCVDCYRQFNCGVNHYNWQGGLTSASAKIRNSVEYKKWRIAVFERDNYTCQVCKKVGGVLNADHIKPFSLFPNDRLDVNNGRTICLECHKLTDSYLSNLIVNKEKYVRTYN